MCAYQLLVLYNFKFKKREIACESFSHWGAAETSCWQQWREETTVSHKLIGHMVHCLLFLYCLGKPSAP